MLLEVAGYRVAEITGAADLANFRSASGTDQAIIADFDLGAGMNGLEVALEIMRRAGERIPTLILSASFGERSLAAAAEYDMPVMFKPVPEELVLAWVAEVVDRRQPGTSSPSEPKS
jgi:DNA-binding response OmpR family regulator